MSRDDVIRKVSSRKLWLAVAAFLASLGAGLAGFASGSEALAVAGGVCCAASGAVYAACEAYVDGQSARATQTISTTSVSATSASQKVVEKALAPDAREA